MIRALRRSALLVAVTLMALLSTVSMSALPLLHGGDDPACDLYAAVHDSSQHRFVPAGTVPADTPHCIICHWSQWARAIQDDAAVVTPAFVSAPIVMPGAGQLLTDNLSLSVARAPPLA